MKENTQYSKLKYEFYPLGKKIVPVSAPAPSISMKINDTLVEQKQQNQQKHQLQKPQQQQLHKIQPELIDRKR